MKCKSARILISAVVDGELTERERLALDAHLAECVNCRGERKSAEALRRNLTVWEAEEPAESLADAFALRLRREQESRARGWRALIFPRLPAFGLASAVAAAVLVLVYVAVQPRHQAPEPGRPMIVKTAPNHVAPSPRAASTTTGLGAPAAVTHPREWVARAPRRTRQYRIADIGRLRRPAPVMIALAPATADAARALAESEAVRRVTEKAAHLRTLMAEADITVEGAILRPETEVSASSDVSDLETDAGTPG